MQKTYHESECKRSIPSEIENKGDLRNLLSLCYALFIRDNGGNTHIFITSIYWNLCHYVSCRFDANWGKE